MYYKKKEEKSYTFDEAKLALENFCIYQDRCHKEVEEKLYKMNMIPLVQEQIIEHLITENFLNEERFAQSFARGKFRIKKYGKNRIVQELKFKGISEYLIKVALKEIDAKEYYSTLEHMAHKKWENTKEVNFYKKKKKVVDFLLRKGYEYEMITEILSIYHP